MKKITIIGAGSWGTALTIALCQSHRPHRISLWVHNNDVAQMLRDRRVNEVYLPGFELPPEIEVTQDFATALADADYALGVMPSAHARSAYTAMQPHLRQGVPIISATKGIEAETLLRMSELIANVCGKPSSSPVAVLSGPSFAREVAQGHPTAIVIASRDAALAAEIQEEFFGPALRLYTNCDVTGVELGGAVKNIIAIAAGVGEGMELGHNAMAALITRGLAEIMRLGNALGAKSETLAGLAGLGDLVLTCTGSLSRNRAVGIELGRGKKIAEILRSTRMVAEGVGAASAVWALAQRRGVDMPITEQMYAVLYDGRSPRDAIRDLMTRPLKNE
jgi:glycerol-3-phosphate dehydrogenase (NAD(P)+)